jgi:hypothetical protein
MDNDRGRARLEVTVDGIRLYAAQLAGIWRSIAVVMLGVVVAGVAVAYGVPAFPVVILFADLLVFWHIRLLAAERRGEARLDEAAFQAATLELAVVKAPHRERLAPAQPTLPFNQWVAGIRAGNATGERGAE